VSREGDVRVLIMLVRAFIKQAERYGHDYHEFAGCPHGAMEFSDYGLRRGCVLCQINHLLLKLEKSMEGG